MNQIDSNDTRIVKQIGLPLYMAKGWLKFLGVLSVIYGVFTALSIFGILICWLPIWMGILLFRAAGNMEVAELNGDQAQLVEGLNRLKTYFTINGILTLIMLVAVAISFMVAGGSMLAMLSSMG
ncbi:MAG: hypothetical protein GF346_03655 [Candidatus Eisenbacteria bacterium]|nr:hypothetical protein [Candidatus Latescibacterota bacterium]MBD3301519.1 hypothetical protein [Candidatus Eisenbacteria bacterium]